MWLTLTRELNYYFNNAKEAIVISFLFVSITLVIPFAFSADHGLPHGVDVAILWVALLCAVQLAAAQSWQRHADSGELELLPLLPWMLEWTVMGKSLAFLIMLVLQLLVIVPIASPWLGIEAGRWPQLWLGLGAGALGLTCLSQMAAGLMAGQRKSGAFLGLIVLPFAIPLIIFGVSYTQQPVLLDESLGFLFGYGIFLWPLHSLAIAASIRHGH